MVDVDGTLVVTDLLWEGLARVVFHNPGELPYVFAGLLAGRAEFKARVADAADLDLDLIPTSSRVLAIVADARRRERRVILASAAHRSQVERLGEMIGADLVLATDVGSNLKGESKLAALRKHASQFDYIGDSTDDMPLFQAARRGYLMDPGPVTRRRLEGSAGDLELVESDRSETIRAWIRQLRPHQWVKNGLLLLPILAAHLEWTLALAVDVLTGLISFSLLASAVYVGNDLADLSSDRRHPTKRERPLASGAVSIPVAVATLPVLVGTSAALALTLPVPFAMTLGVYVALNVGYTWGIKRLLVLDVVVLAALYTIRVVAGSALASIELTGWFLAFAIFFFLSLAVLKRVIEVETQGELDDEDGGYGRSYTAADLPVLRAVGPGAGLMSALVYCLYITGPVRQLYDRPDLLWMGLPLFLYWIIRVWMLALRGQVEDDPVVFVLRDRASYAVLLGFLAVVFLAS